MSQLNYYNTALETPDGEVRAIDFMTPDRTVFLQHLKSYVSAGWKILEVKETIPGYGVRTLLTNELEKALEQIDENACPRLTGIELL